ncbi:MAG: endonuclease/exonuclease/phosphatase family protein [Spirochaetia bacterium]|nr:endonuclease/exonuclease/phosphatase family protein [Spirochaetia bacterium]
MDPQKTSLRILSFNIHKGFDAGNTRFVLGLVRREIREVGADLVFLQEVSGENRRITDRAFEPQFEFLADGVWSHFAYGKNAVTQIGHHGNAILSRFPIVAHHNLDLSTNRFEKRGLLHAAIRLSDGSTLHALSLHLNLFERSRQVQVGKVVRYLAEKIDPRDKIILAGDFNDWRERISHRMKNEAGLNEAFQVLHGRHARTFPSFFPILHLDRIYFRGFEAREAKRLHGPQWKKLSDHLAVTALLEQG